MHPAAVGKVKAKVSVSLACSAGGLPRRWRGEAQHLANVTTPATAPPGKGQAHGSVPVSLRSSHSDVLPDRLVLPQNLESVPGTAANWSSCFSVDVYVQAQPREEGRLPVS